MKFFLLPLTVAFLSVQTAVNAAKTLTFESIATKPSSSKLLLAGFLDDIKDSVESVQDTVEGTNETAKDTVDAVHGTNEAVGESRQLIKGENSQDSTVVDVTEMQETTENQESPDNSGNSF